VVLLLAAFLCGLCLLYYSVQNVFQTSMNSAYNIQWVYNLAVIKESKRWAKHNFITTEQFAKISIEYITPLYHPNLIIRILLFIATLLPFRDVGYSGAMFCRSARHSFISVALFTALDPSLRSKKCSSPIIILSRA